MARRRMIDPNFWVSEDVAALTFRQRLLLVGLFSNADDHGRGRAKPAFIRSVIFPYDDLPTKEIEADLQAIAKHISIVFYEVDGNSYYQFLNWSKWQTVQKPQPSIIPPPPNTNSKNDSGISQESVKNDSGMSTESVKNDSRLKEEEGKRKEDRREVEEKGRGMGEPKTEEHDQQDVAETERQPPPEPLPEHTQTEREILKELKAVPGYPYAFLQDLDYIRNLMVEFPSLDLLTEARRWRTYKRDRPLKPKSNARLQFRNWCEKAAQWQQEKEKGVKSDGQRSRASPNLDKFLWRGT